MFRIPRPVVADVPDFRSQPRAFLQALLDVAVQQAQPMHTLAAHLPPPPDPAVGRTLVLGAGKAAAAMAQALEAHWPATAPLSGLVVTRYGHVPPRPAGLPQRVQVLQAAHPVPDAASQQAAQRMLALAQGLGPHDLVVFLASGGGSALLSLPVDGLGLADKQRIHQALLHSGAAIDEMNCVRKHLSAIKGGRLAAACAPAQVVTLAISDVPGDDLSVIASGPTVPDPTTCAQALSILARYGIDLPAPVAQALAQGTLETPKPDTAQWARHTQHLIATPWQSLHAAAEVARAVGLPTHVLSDSIEGEAREVAKVHAALARAVAQRKGPFTAPCLLLSGGETTVTVAPGTPPGQGGRAVEFALALAHALQGQAGVWSLAADTDGIDGTGPHAGAWVTPDILARATQAGYSATASLAAHNAAPYFAASGDLLTTGPTFTNVNDFRAVLVL